MVGDPGEAEAALGQFWIGRNSFCAPLRSPQASYKRRSIAEPEYLSQSESNPLEQSLFLRCSRGASALYAELVRATPREHLSTAAASVRHGIQENAVVGLVHNDGEIRELVNGHAK
jgi:hypothetical protein